MRASGQFMKYELDPLPLPRRTIESMSTVDAMVGLITNGFFYMDESSALP